MGQVSVWTGTQLIIWGGASVYPAKAKMLGDGAAYDPSVRRWTTLPRSPLSPRVDASAVWDGRAMLVWGGITHLNPNNTDQLASNGAAYNPRTHSWTLLPPGPLSARDSATMLWTGTDAIVFGGVAAGSKSSTRAASYQPAPNRWTPLPSFPKPAHGSPISASVTWTGHDLVDVETYETIHHFHDGISIRRSTVAATLARGSSAWNRLRAPPAQAALYQATATWTGRQIVFTGGTDCLPEMSCPSQPASPMWAYTPATRHWSALRPSPVIGYGDPVLWTGRAIAVLAGSTPSTARVYDPKAAVWHALPRDSALGYDDGTAVAAWTGKQLLLLSSLNHRNESTVTNFSALTPKM